VGCTTTRKKDKKEKSQKKEGNLQKKLQKDSNRASYDPYLKARKINRPRKGKSERIATSERGLTKAGVGPGEKRILDATSKLMEVNLKKEDFQSGSSGETRGLRKQSPETQVKPRKKDVLGRKSYQEVIEKKVTKEELVSNRLSTKEKKSRIGKC